MVLENPCANVVYVSQDLEENSVNYTSTKLGGKSYGIQYLYTSALSKRNEVDEINYF